MPMDKKDETSSACLIGAVRVAPGHPTFWMDLGAQSIWDLEILSTKASMVL